MTSKHETDAKNLLGGMSTFDSIIAAITEKQLIIVKSHCQERGIATMIGVHKDFDSTLTTEQSEHLGEILSELGEFIAVVFDTNANAVEYIATQEHERRRE